MHDIKWIRENPQAFDDGLKRRGLSPLSPDILDLDAKHRATLTLAQDLQARRNKLSKDIGIAKAKGEDTSDLLKKVLIDKDLQATAEADAERLKKELDDQLAVLPNLPAADVPDGPDATANKEVRRWGEPTKFDFTSKDHADLGEALGFIDFERAAKISGARFTVLSGPIARLHRALGQFMLDLHTQPAVGDLGGYTEIDPPVLVRSAAVYGTGNLPKFRADLFQALAEERVSLDEFDTLEPIGGGKGFRIETSDPDLVVRLNEAARRKVVIGKAGPKAVKLENLWWLIPTAEVSLTNLVAGETLDEATLPRRYTALTACFRAEAGAAGKDTRGILRQHQFYKVELVSIAHPEKSDEEHKRMTACAEEVLKRLKLPYRTVVLCTGDMGFAARKTHDIEVWLPGQNAYREISSCSNCGDFQARRMNARFRKAGEKGTQFVHTLNGSGLAVGRTLIAVMENYQQNDGTIRVPDALKPYMGGLDVIAPAKKA
jgi:seryl-tRNA synthetase